MLCPNCETDNRDDASFCQECGFPLSGAIARVGGAASPVRVEPERGHAQRQRAQSSDDGLAESSGRRTQDVSEPSSLPHNVDSGEGALAAEEPEREAGPAIGHVSDEAPFDDPDGYSEQPYDDEYRRYDEGYDDWSRPASSFGFYPERPYEAAGDETDAGDGFWHDDITMQMPRIEGGESRVNRDFRASSSVKRTGGKKALVITVAVLAAIAALAVAACFALGIWGGKTVPDVVGMTEADAQSVLEGEGFSVRSTRVKSDETEGLVLIMDPGAGSLAPEGSEVVIHVAMARFIPDVNGKTREEAQRLFEEAGYDNVTYEAEKSDGDENIVLSVSPEAGTRAKSSVSVLVKVSENYRVPDISGLGLDGSLSAIREAGLTPEVVYFDTDQYPDGTVIGTSPEAGAKVSEGDYVTLTVSRLRGVELIALTQSLLSEGGTVTIGGVDYQVETVIAMDYQGNDTVSYTMTARPFVQFFGETLFASSSQTLSGQVVWSSSNEVVSIS